jgi:Na+/melibiose symporter-like transporter
MTISITLILIIAVVAFLLILFSIGYLKAPPDKAYIISGMGTRRILIGMAGYDGNLAVQPASAITMVRLLYSLIPAGMYIIVYLVCRFYKLDKMMPEIKKANELNRAAAKAAQTENK